VGDSEPETGTLAVRQGNGYMQRRGRQAARRRPPPRPLRLTGSPRAWAGM